MFIVVSLLQFLEGVRGFNKNNKIFLNDVTADAIRVHPQNVDGVSVSSSKIEHACLKLELFGCPGTGCMGYLKNNDNNNSDNSNNNKNSNNNNNNNNNNKNNENDSDSDNDNDDNDNDNVSDNDSDNNNNKKQQ